MLAADIGATNARFALAERSTGQVLARRDYPTAEISNAEDMVRRALADLRRDIGCEAPAAAALAIAGPVAHGYGRLTNGQQEFSAAELAQALSCPVQLLNDFVAVAAAVTDAAPLLPIGSLAQPQPGVRAVLGPGTGLGMAYLVPDSNGHYQALASEGGNADFAPVDELEQELLAITRRKLVGSDGTVSTEELVSGRGLPTLYAAVCELWGSPVQHSDAAAITAAAVDAEDPVCHQTLELFCGMLGSAAGNFALTVGARGGVFLAGGILPRIQSFFLSSAFRQRFEARGAMRTFNEQVPTFLLTLPDPGITGAVNQACAQLR